MDQFKGQPRLPKFAVPKRYDIRLKPDLSACTFAGSVSIVLDIFADTKFIVLNAADLSVNSGSVCFTSSKVFEPVNVELVEADEILVLEFAETLPIGEGVLSIDFDGVLNEKTRGFYKSTYEHQGEKKNMAVTQFELVDTRKCFPCWDKPACKAKFKITLDVPSELVALSNMLVIEETVDGPLKTVSYQETTIMSTYLVAVVVGLFDYVEDHTSDGIKVRVYCQVGKANQGKFALHVAVKTLELYKVYFAVQYPLPKLDMIAVPDFAAGAMENYGLVTYRETALLFDDKHSAAANKQRVVTVVAHELAHQWFGNLVTMEWWTHLWLNEGFATWVSYVAADSLFPEWKVWTQFLEETTEGLRLDGLEGSHPIEVEINHASEIDEIFDAISYRKGASVIQMLQSYLGAECFQKNFLLQTKSETLDAKESSLDEIRSSWVKVNVHQTGFYRVKYDDNLAARLRYAIEKKYLTETDRFGVLEDSFALCMARYQSLTSLLTLMGAYREELEYCAISYKLMRIAADATPELLDYINQFFINLFQISAEKLGWDPKQGESRLDSMLRGEILTALAVFGHDPTINEASRRFHAFVDDRNTPLLPPDIRKVRSQDAVFGLAAVSKKGRETAWTWMKDKWDHISKTYGSGFLITRFVSSVVSPFASFEKAKEVEEFFASRTKPSIARTLKQSIERVNINAKWVQSIQKEKQLAKAVKELAQGKY
ncbi:hypothetical protein P3X46_019754 [Hevea brasiliensis]|uniref:Alpha-aminoacylpeptide hydrolase n=1 Tax=Hevea brasiliensis TaxID=3981 RepID=A0ABQ9LKY2_HEVBR|nr:hypothetical protein P3X46_019754 [Hevea brasiliensis]